MAKSKRSEKRVGDAPDVGEFELAGMIGDVAKIEAECFKKAREQGRSNWSRASCADPDTGALMGYVYAAVDFLTGFAELREEGPDHSLVARRSRDLFEGYE